MRRCRCSGGIWFKDCRRFISRCCVSGGSWRKPGSCRRACCCCSGLRWLRCCIHWVKCCCCPGPRLDRGICRIGGGPCICGCGRRFWAREKEEESPIARKKTSARRLPEAVWQGGGVRIVCSLIIISFREQAGLRLSVRFPFWKQLLVSWWSRWCHPPNCRRRVGQSAAGPLHRCREAEGPEQWPKPVRPDANGQRWHNCHRRRRA